ncbi:MAG: LysM peptidoglycan-binding domain-containing protein, partial [Bacteroidota bacterium]
IAQRFGTTVQAILAANPGLDPNRLVIGQRICIPVPPQPAAAPPSGTEPASPELTAEEPPVEGTPAT